MEHKLRFTKMHGLGNDFVIINELCDQPIFEKNLITQLAHRHLGIGFDQILTIKPAKDADYFCNIYNADGTEALQCGNGLRCVARLVHEEKLHDQKTMRLATKAGIFPVVIEDYAHIHITMGIPIIQEKLSILKLQNKRMNISILSLGNPHAIVKVDTLNHDFVKEIFDQMNLSFAQGINLGLMEIINPEHIRLRTFERGVGETYACGSNACAAAATGIINGWLARRVQVEFSQGSLIVEWKNQNGPITLIGPASRVFSGELEL